MPPRAHDLLYLVRELAITPPRAHLDFVGIINNASVPTRYPGDLSRLVSQYPRRTAISYLARTSRVLIRLRMAGGLSGMTVASKCRLSGSTVSGSRGRVAVSKLGWPRPAALADDTVL